MPFRIPQVADADLLKPYQLMREKYKQQKRRIGNREKETLARLSKFVDVLKNGKPPAPEGPSAPSSLATEKADPAAGAEGAAERGAYAGKIRKDIDHRAYMPAAWRIDDYLAEEDEEDDVEALRNHRLTFAKGAKDDMSRRDDVNDYVVFDPLLEKLKGKFSKRQQGAKKRENEWAGKSRT